MKMGDNHLGFAHVGITHVLAAQFVVGLPFTHA
jgi:hypothetical protein